MKNRILAGLLSICLLLGLLPVSALAADPAEHTHNADGWTCTLTETGRELTCGLEEHTHTEACYTAADPVLFCTQEEHTHGQECRDADGYLTCTIEEHQHGDSCWQAAEAELICGLEEHTHAEECWAAVSEWNCTPPQEETPAPQEEPPANGVGEQNVIEIATFEALNNSVAMQIVEAGTTQQQQLDLPQTLAAFDTDGNSQTVPVTWNSSPAFDGDAVGEYLFTPMLESGYTLGADTVLPTITVQVESSFTEVTSIDEILTAIRQHTGDSPLMLKMTTDVAFPSGKDIPIHVPSGKSVVLDLNGHRLDASNYPRKADWLGDGYESPIRVSGTFTMQDSYENGKYGEYTGSAALEGAVHVNSGGVFTLKSGAIFNDPEYPLGRHYTRGGGVHVSEGAEFYMTGGMISCTLGGVDQKGGGVYNAGTFEMSGGQLYRCDTEGKGTSGVGTGGGVYNDKTGVFTMNGGEIRQCGTGMYNWSMTNGGGGVFNWGTFTMNDGVIRDCINRGDEIQDSSAVGGGGVQNWGTFTMTGGTITGNNSGVDKGDGVENNGTFIMTGGTISNNRGMGVSNGTSLGSRFNKDGEPFCTFATFSMTDGTITGNTSHGVHNRDSFTMTDSTISDNGGYGVYNQAGKHADSRVTTDVDFTMTRSTISSNKKCGVYCYGLSDDRITMTLDQCTIAQNGTSGINASCTDLTMKGGTITDNNGYGISTNSTNFTMDGGTITNNKNTGVYIGYGSAFTRISGDIYNNQASSYADDIYITSGSKLSLGPVGDGLTLSPCGHPITGWFDDAAGSRWHAALDGAVCGKGSQFHAVEFDENDPSVIDPETGAAKNGILLKAAHEHEPSYGGTVTLSPAEVTLMPTTTSSSVNSSITNTGTDPLTNYQVDFYFPDKAGSTISGVSQEDNAAVFTSEFGLRLLKAPRVTRWTGSTSAEYSIKYYIGETEYSDFPAEQDGAVTRVSITWKNFTPRDEYFVNFSLGAGADCTFSTEKSLNAYVGVSYQAEQLPQKNGTPTHFKTTTDRYHTAQFILLNDSLFNSPPYAYAPDQGQWFVSWGDSCGRENPIRGGQHTDFVHCDGRKAHRPQRLQHKQRDI